MADRRRAPVIRWSPDDGVAELDAGAPGPAGVSTLTVGRVTLLVDTAVPEGYLGVRIEADDDIQAFRALARLGLHVPTGDLDEAWETTVRPSTALLDPTALPAVVLAEILAADDLPDEARTVATAEMALAALDAARIWPGLDEAARRALWEVVSDPATALAVDRLEHRGRIGLLADRIDSLVGRTGDPDLDVALRTLRSTDRRNRPGGARPVAATFDAPAGADLAAGALAEGATEAVGLRVERVGDEVRATPPLGARPTAWVRVARREGRVLIAAAPVTSLLDGVVRLPVPATLPTRDLIVDVVDDPAVAVRSAAAGRVEQAVRAGRDAVTIARRRGWEPARERWGDCADHWDAAGDHLRAEQAAANATKPPVSRPFAHDRL